MKRKSALAAVYALHALVPEYWRDWFVAVRTTPAQLRLSTFKQTIVAFHLKTTHFNNLAAKGKLVRMLSTDFVKMN
ncbi:unnamed protein product [Acanthoscelides obtectus]|uniref:Uncharacterized protein n=1 Tax=Acanthoscelides obtectus TaxID=200917 RepID=A0A9P0KWK8_ACAOB|nr:unnamed protein product [Acanthoscelides obtectus]CAK1654612.1 hypothetical protein AOBTE_LOCUS18713 [Acanthoscelides obtectus]